MFQIKQVSLVNFFIFVAIFFRRFFAAHHIHVHATYLPWHLISSYAIVFAHYSTPLPPPSNLLLQTKQIDLRTTKTHAHISISAINKLFLFTAMLKNGFPTMQTQRSELLVFITNLHNYIKTNLYERKFWNKCWEITCLVFIWIGCLILNEN